MRIITGAILIVGAIWLFGTALPYGNIYGSMSVVVKLAFILSGLTAMIGLFYLLVGSVEAREHARWYQFTVKSLLAVTAMVALFFSGRALGLREAESPYSSAAIIPPPVAYPATFSTTTPSSATAVPEPIYSVSPTMGTDPFASSGDDPSVLADPSAPRQPPTPSSVSGPEKPSARPAAPAAQTP
jgi:hypothetical protein